MADKNRVNLMVHSETKAEWDSAVEDSTEYSSLSDLVRQSVAYELADDSAHSPTQTSVSDDSHTEAHTEMLVDIASTLSRVESTLKNMDQRITNLEDEFSAPKQTELKNEIFKTLPHSGSITASEIAERIDADRDRVSTLLSKLSTQTNLVEEADSPDGQNYYRRGEQ